MAKDLIAKDMVLVGAGDYFEKLVKPCVPKLREMGYIDRFFTVDIVPKEGPNHYVREPGQPLSEVIRAIGSYEPIVVLGHRNDLHTPDAEEILTDIWQFPLGEFGRPSLLLEKPYATDLDQMDRLESLVENNGSRIALLEYYLSMKSIPLLWFGGVVNAGSFYSDLSNGILKVDGNISRWEEKPTLEELWGGFEKRIGKPLFVVSEVLEGEGDYGRIEHRNSSIVDRRVGGGMIQDLGHHALTPLMALEIHLGKITPESLDGLRTACCTGYLNHARKNLGLDEQDIGESYAELDINTSTGVPVRISLGKYVEAGKNQRRIIITGTRGVVLYDLTNNILAYRTGDSSKTSDVLLEADKNGVPKYLAVLIAGINEIDGNNPFTFNPAKVALGAQRFVLDTVTLVPDKSTEYLAGTMHDQIFGK